MHNKKIYIYKIFRLKSRKSGRPFNIEALWQRTLKNLRTLKKKSKCFNIKDQTNGLWKLFRSALKLGPSKCTFKFFFNTLCTSTFFSSRNTKCTLKIICLNHKIWNWISILFFIHLIDYRKMVLNPHLSSKNMILSWYRFPKLMTNQTPL